MGRAGCTDKVAKDIKSLKIQGARRIAKAAVEALAEAAEKSRAKSADELHSDLLVAADRLASARETEPMLRNCLDELLSVVKAKRGEGVPKLKSMLAQKQDEILGNMEASVARIAYYGAEVVPDGGTVLIHCHSTTLMSILKLAKKQGKKFKVVCTETRPKFQGRVSAVELAEAGIDTTLVVDSAAGGIINAAGMGEYADVGRIDVVLFGADAITSRGELLNKVGTYQIAVAAKGAGAKVFSAAELYKYDPNTEGGRQGGIEQRDVRELADNIAMIGKWRKAGVKLRNPAFDITPPELIDAFITEEGIIEPKEIGNAANTAIGEKRG